MLFGPSNHPVTIVHHRGVAHPGGRLELMRAKNGVESNISRGGNKGEFLGVGLSLRHNQNQKVMSHKINIIRTYTIQACSTFPFILCGMSNP